MAIADVLYRFGFDENNNFMLTKASGESIGENVVVGGENKWACDSFINYRFLPGEKFPILVYFKETQTPKSNWVEAPIVVDQLEGQVHFFPAITNVKELAKQFELHNCKHI